MKSDYPTFTPPFQYDTRDRTIYDSTGFSVLEIDGDNSDLEDSERIGTRIAELMNKDCEEGEG